MRLLALSLLLLLLLRMNRRRIVVVAAVVVGYHRFGQHHTWKGWFDQELNI